MNPVTGPAQPADPNTDIEADFWRELVEIETESIGWQPLGPGCYLHVGTDQPVVDIVGLASSSMANSNVLWIV